MKNSILKVIFKILLISLIIYAVWILLNLYFGWYGNEQWKYRRITYGDKNLSIKRNVFVKNLAFKSSISLNDFKVFIEKGHKYDFNGVDKIRLINNSKYPYQVSMSRADTLNKFIYSIVNYNKFDSIDNKFLNYCVYLDKPYLKDTIVLKIIKLYGSNDSIGYIKVWDKTNKK